MQSCLREFCERCLKAAVLCVCGMIGEPIHNRIRVTVLQNPEEKEHHLGSVRVAMLGLKNIEVIVVPQINTGTSYRVRPKVAGSNRCMRNGSPAEQDELVVCQQHDRTQHDCWFYGCATMDPYLPRTAPSWINLSPNAALIFPSDRAQDLHAMFPGVKFGHRSGVDGGEQGKESGEACRAPDQIIVIDGTWSKARRLYMENPWLFQLPQYKLPASFKSMYEFVRPEPRPGCMSTLEGIVYALKVFEPEATALESLLDVFEAMIQKQREYMLMKTHKHGE
ncbi:hypothetical protein SELMODRAFT_426163 [Selaginella moellendorffii]|uniref:tRNA-uridine aminocarboxypropyltransferase n=1 Tax=Selaginella moellendorffii TaxID=88036 RepID=D8SVI6_SELML|nr:hypothetical protein SELMODRAFT_426163 [Selaginella moellendorffii]